VLDFYRKPTEEAQGFLPLEERLIGSLLLEPRSLVVLTDDMYRLYLHGIAERTEDAVDTSTIFNAKSCSVVEKALGAPVPRGTRLSITIRNVPHVAKLGVRDLVGK